MLKNIPNTITSLNLLSGCFSILFACSGQFEIAFICIILAAVFDFFDGMAARALKAYSPIGKELDSLADMVSFGVAPAIMMVMCAMMIVSSGIDEFTGSTILQKGYSNLVIFMPLLIAVFSGIRLAKFNIDTRQTENFIGLATPACALLCGSLIYSSEVYPPIAIILVSYPFIFPILAIILSYLLISEIPMFSFKFKNFTWQDNSIRFIFLGIVAMLGILTILFRVNWSVWILSIFICYILLNVIKHLIPKKN